MPRRRRTRLTRQQRREYAADLKAGVPETVIKEFDSRLTAYIAAYKAALIKHFRRRDD
jgi:hypothetical protein